jgi:hypothetical protein
MSIFCYFTLTHFATNPASLITLLVFSPTGGYVFGALMWRINESMYLAAKRHLKENEPPDEP